MRIPVIPVAVVVILIAIAAAFLTSSGPPTFELGAPAISALLDVDGWETEVAASPDESRFALIASGDLWLAGPDGAEQLTRTPEAESAPMWTPDSARITFTRGPDTLQFDLATREESIYRTDAVELTTAPDGRVGFVRDRALWIAGTEGAETELLPADPDPAVTLKSLRFSPNLNRLLFIKSRLGRHGSVWIADLVNDSMRPLVADRIAENPSGADWIDNNRIVYLTDRSGAPVVWYIRLDDETMIPLTGPLMERMPARLGIDAVGERIVLPRYRFDSGIATITGTRLVDTPALEYSPALSPRGDRLAYTIANQGRFEIWIADAGGADPEYLSLGEFVRFAPNGLEIVYAHTALDGNRDIWQADIRTGLTVRLTDYRGVDDTPDWSPDGRSIVFSSHRDGRIELWTLPPGGGQKLLLGGGLEGFAPRYSPDGAQIAYWADGRVWTANADGSSPGVVGNAPEPVFPEWDGNRVLWVRDGRIEGPDNVMPDLVWPEMGPGPDGAILTSPIRIDTSELIAMDITFTEVE
jgi:Tol biopolymer transport system component